MTRLVTCFIVAFLGMVVDGQLSIIKQLIKQIQFQDFAAQERVRSEGQSGIKQVRLVRQGTRNYYGDTHSGTRISAIHDHANNVRTIGMGEVIAVLNGIEFRTRHNDYRLSKPSTTSNDYHSIEDIDFPDVPMSVLNANGLEAQLEEMRQYFKAWAAQDTAIRADYKDFFKPVLCYMEGAWTSTGDAIEESFESDRHHLDAETWFDLLEKIKFTSATGNKDRLENYAFLPTTIVDILDDGSPVFAQWNYRILCHPLKNDIPLDHLRLHDDLSSRISLGMTQDEWKGTRAARFQLSPDSMAWPKIESTSYDYARNYQTLDMLMGEIPGKDNYGANLEDTGLNLQAFSYANRSQVLNAANYHRWFIGGSDAMGQSRRHRGFADENLFVALNSQSKVVPAKLAKCYKDSNNQDKPCEQRVSYAIPLEIIYLTPLSKWNPHNLEYKGNANSPEGRTVNADGQDGSEDNCFNGMNSKKFFQTPSEFFSDTLDGSDPADTAPDSVYVCKNGNKFKVSASGLRIKFPSIAGINENLRQRYPITPVHGEGSAVWKEEAALEDLVMQMVKNQHLYQTPPLKTGGTATGTGTSTASLNLQLQTSRLNGTTPHIHSVTLTPDQHAAVLKNQTVTISSEERESHSHELKIKCNRFNTQGECKAYFYDTCDGSLRCRDRHPKKLLEV